MPKKVIKFLKNEEGLVSFLAVIFISVLLSIIVTSLVRVMINESRVSIDFDQSSKAFYAAEAGIEDAIIEIQTAMDNNGGDPTSAIKDTCGGAVEVISSSGTDEVEYTCQLINISPILKEGHINTDNSALLSIDTINDDFNEISLWWNLKDKDFETSFPSPSLSSNPDADGWGQAPALIKLTIVEYPRGGGDFTRDEIEHYVHYLYPRSRNVGVGSQSVDLKSGSRSNSDDPSSPRYEVNRTAEPRHITDCNPNNAEYSCQMTIENLDNANNRYMVIAKALYNDASYSFEVKNNGVPLEISGNEVIIDVTGRAGTVFRRVVAKIPLRSNSFGEDYVILSDRHLCKDFDITRETNRADRRGDPVDDGCITYNLNN